VAEVARSHRLSWPTVQRAVTAAVTALPPEPAPTPLLGIDETRFGRPRWRQNSEIAAHAWPPGPYGKACSWTWIVSAPATGSASR